MFDFGPDGAFAENARELGIDLTAADTSFLSHGHSDHAGGLETFCRLNGRAKIWMSREAFGPYYAVDPGCPPVYIGPDPALRTFSQRFAFADGVAELDEELTVFSGVPGNAFHAAANDKLRVRREDDYLPDPFRHEQHLLIREEGKTVLLAGCGHQGIVNILRRAEELAGGPPDLVLAGFHLTNPSTGTTEPPETLRAIGEELAARQGTVYYTGHCTGEAAFAALRDCLDTRLRPFSGGTVIEI